MSGLDTAQCKALRGLELHDLVLQGHHVQLHGAPGRVFTLFGRLDSWEAGVHPSFLTAHLKALGSPEGPSLVPTPLRVSLRDGGGGGVRRVWLVVSAGLSLPPCPLCVAGWLGIFMPML